MTIAGRIDKGDTAPPKASGAMTPFQRFQRSKLIAEMRSRTINGKLKPVAWKVISQQIGLSVPQCQHAYAQYRVTELSEQDPAAVISSTADTFTVVLEQAWQTYQDADPGSNVRVQALGRVMHAAMTRVEFMQAAGMLPASLAGPSVQAELQLMLQKFSELLRRHDVPDEALEDFLAMAEDHMRSASSPVVDLQLSGLFVV